MRTALTEQSSAWATAGAPASLPAKAQLPRAGRDAGAPGTYPAEPVGCSPSRRFISMMFLCSAVMLGLTVDPGNGQSLASSSPLPAPSKPDALEPTDEA